MISIEDIENIIAKVSMINVSDGDDIDKRSKQEALELLIELKKNLKVSE